MDADNMDGDGLTALEIALRGCHQEVEMVGVILDAGADINHRDSGGLTPLDSAALLGHPQLLSYLLERGAAVTSNSWKQAETSADIL